MHCEIRSGSSTTMHMNSIELKVPRPKNITDLATQKSPDRNHIDQYIKSDFELETMTDTKRILYDFESFQVLKGVHWKHLKDTDTKNLRCPQICLDQFLRLHVQIIRDFLETHTYKAWLQWRWRHSTCTYCTALPKFRLKIKN
jgi:hypothetical protein